MQGISEQDHAVNRKILVIGGELSRDAAAHGLAADKQGSPGAHEMVARSPNDGTKTSLQPWQPIWNPTMLLGVEEVERDRIDAERSERAGEIDNESALLSGTSTVSEYQRRDSRPIGRVDERRRDGARLDFH